MSPSRARSWHDAQYECSECGELREVKYQVDPADYSVGIMSPGVESVTHSPCSCGATLTDDEAEAVALRDLEHMVESYGDREHDE